MITYKEWTETNDLFWALENKDPSLFIFKEIPANTCRLISLNRFGNREVIPVYVGQPIEDIATVMLFELKDLFINLESAHLSDELNIGSKTTDYRERKLASLEEEIYHNVSVIKESKKISYDNLFKNIKNASEISMVYLAIKSIIDFITLEVY